MEKHLERLEGVHPDLLRVVHRAFLLRGDLTVLEGLRSAVRQAQMVAEGKSQTMKSRHLDGHAVDLGVFVVGALSWEWPVYAKLAVTMKQAARDERVTVEWGGDWKTLKDGPHFQLPWATYPSQPSLAARSPPLVS